MVDTNSNHRFGDDLLLGRPRGRRRPRGRLRRGPGGARRGARQRRHERRDEVEARVAVMEDVQQQAVSLLHQQDGRPWPSARGSTSPSELDKEARVPHGRRLDGQPVMDARSSSASRSRPARAARSAFTSTRCCCQRYTVDASQQTTTSSAAASRSCTTGNSTSRAAAGGCPMASAQLGAWGGADRSAPARTCSTASARTTLACRRRRTCQKMAGLPRRNSPGWADRSTTSPSARRFASSPVV